MHHAHYSLRLGTAMVTRTRLERQYRKIVAVSLTPLLTSRNKSGQSLRGRVLANYHTWPKNNSNQNNNNASATNSPPFNIFANFAMRTSCRQDASTAKWFKPNPKRPSFDARTQSYFPWNSVFHVSRGSSGRHPSEFFRLGSATKCRSSLAILACKAMGKKDKAGLVESIRSRK